MNEITSDEFFNQERDIYINPFIYSMENSTRNPNHVSVHQTNETEIITLLSDTPEEASVLQELIPQIDNQDPFNLVSENNFSDRLSILLHNLALTSFFQTIALIILILSSFVKYFTTLELFSVITGFVSVIISILFRKEKTWKYAFYMSYYAILLISVLIYLLISLVLWLYYEIQIAF